MFMAGAWRTPDPQIHQSWSAFLVVRQPGTWIDMNIGTEMVPLISLINQWNSMFVQQRSRFNSTETATIRAHRVHTRPYGYIYTIHIYNYTHIYVVLLNSEKLCGGKQSLKLSSCQVIRDGQWQLTWRRSSATKSGDSLYYIPIFITPHLNPYINPFKSI